MNLVYTDEIQSSTKTFRQYILNMQFQTVTQRVDVGTCRAPPGSETMKTEPCKHTEEIIDIGELHNKKR